MPGIPELLLILVIVLIIFGPGKLPMLGEALGKAIRSFRKTSKEKNEIDITPVKTEIVDHKNAQITEAEVSTSEIGKEKETEKIKS